jgi:hypothetical protein
VICPPYGLWLAVPSASMRGAAAVWTAILLVIVGAVGLTVWSERLPAPRPDTAPLDEFSAARAMEVLRLQTDLGRRLSGTPNERLTADRLAARLREIPGMEVRVEEVSSSRQYLDTPFTYPLIVSHVWNVLGRLPGRSDEAVLLDAHFDTTGSSDGAGDDAFGVAAMVEAVRALAANGTPPERTILVLLNGGEEYGLRGAEGFVHGPEAARVRSYLYIDGMARGRTRLVTTTRGHPELIDALAHAMPHPSANVIIQDIVEGGAVGGVDGDRRPFEDAGLVGITLACVDDLAASHTERDRADRVDPAALQEMGDTTLALVRELAGAEGPRSDASEAPRPVYFDLLGVVLVHYGRQASHGFALLACLVATGALVRVVRRGRLSPRGIAIGTGLTALAQIAGLVAALSTAALLSFAIGRPHGWYAHPWLAGIAFPCASASAILAVHALARRRLSSDEDGAWLAWCGALLGWVFWLVLAELRDAGASYLALVWTVSLGLGLLAADRWPERLWPLAVLACVPGAVITANVAIPTLRAMLPQTGYMPLPIPADVPVALMISLASLGVLGALVVSVHTCGGLARGAAALAITTVIGVSALASLAPYDRESPRRILATHAEEEGRSAIVLGSFDVLPMDDVVRGLGDTHPPRDDWHPLGPYYVPTHELDAPAPPFDPPHLEVERRDPLGADGTRVVALRVVVETAHAQLYVPRARLAAWSLGPMPPEPASGEDDMILFVAPRPEGERVELTLRGEEPVRVEVRAVEPRHGPALEALAARMPDWVVFWPEMTRIVHTAL